MIDVARLNQAYDNLENFYEWEKSIRWDSGVMNYRFYKDDIGWFIDIPDWQESRMELQMVCGADDLCDILSEGNSEFNIDISLFPFEDCETIRRTKLGRLEGFEYGSGAWYELNSYKNTPKHLEMWLCDVTKFVFGEFPIEIHFKKTK
jgi:hypothetical protein